MLAALHQHRSINQSNYFIVRPEVDQRAGQLSLPHVGITKTEKIELKHKTDEQISPVNGLEPCDSSAVIVTTLGSSSAANKSSPFLLSAFLRSAVCGGGNSVTAIVSDTAEFCNMLSIFTGIGSKVIISLER